MLGYMEVHEVETVEYLKKRAYSNTPNLAAAAYTTGCISKCNARMMMNTCSHYLWACGLQLTMAYLLIQVGTYQPLPINPL